MKRFWSFVLGFVPAIVAVIIINRVADNLGVNSWLIFIPFFCGMVYGFLRPIWDAVVFAITGDENVLPGRGRRY